MNLSINLATRGRPDLLRETVARTLPLIADPGTRLVVSIDDDDRATMEAIDTLPQDARVLYHPAPREDSLGEKYNRILTVAPADVYLVMVDYAPQTTPAFDTKVIEAAQRFPDGHAVVLNHLANLSFSQLNAVTAKMAAKMGGIYPAYFPFWFVDHWLEDVAKLTGRGVFADVVVDCSKRPGTQDKRDTAFWASFFDTAAPLRHDIAESIIADLDEPEWLKTVKLANFPLTDERSRILNAQVRQQSASEPMGMMDDRYRRIKNRALRALTTIQADHRRKIERSILDEPFGQQHPGELKWMLERITGARSILEIGSCTGQSLRMIADVLAPGAKIRAIDLGVLPQQAGIFAGSKTAGRLNAVADDLRGRGFDVLALFADSHSDEAVRWATKEGGPDGYDVIFIDGDHSQDGVKADWKNYGGLGRTVFFHDIAHPACGVAGLWREIEASHATAKAVFSHMGIGMVAMAEAKEAAA